MIFTGPLRPSSTMFVRSAPQARGLFFLLQSVVYVLSCVHYGPHVCRRTLYRDLQPCSQHRFVCFHLRCERETNFGECSGFEAGYLQSKSIISCESPGSALYDGEPKNGNERARTPIIALFVSTKTNAEKRSFRSQWASKGGECSWHSSVRKEYTTAKGSN